MKTCIDIFKEYKGESEIGGSIYIDPLGFEFSKSIISCYECMFNFSYESCVLYKEAGWDDNEILKKVRGVSQSNECQYFLIKDFSEGGDEDEIARKEINNISERLNYPAEYWRRVRGE